MNSCLWASVSLDVAPRARNLIKELLRINKYWWILKATQEILTVSVIWLRRVKHLLIVSCLNRRGRSTEDQQVNKQHRRRFGFISVFSLTQCEDWSTSILKNFVIDIAEDSLAYRHLLLFPSFMVSSTFNPINLSLRSRSRGNTSSGSESENSNREQRKKRNRWEIYMRMSLIV